MYSGVYFFPLCDYCNAAGDSRTLCHRLRYIITPLFITRSLPGSTPAEQNPVIFHFTAFVPPLCLSCYSVSSFLLLPSLFLTSARADRYVR